MLKKIIIKMLTITIITSIIITNVYSQSQPNLTIHNEGEDGISSITFSPDGSKIMTTWKTVKIFDAHTGELLKILRPEIAPMTAAFSPDEKLVVTAGADMLAKLYDLESATEIFSFQGILPYRQVEMFIASVFMPNGNQVILGSLRGDIYFWDLVTNDGVKIADTGTNISKHYLYPDGSKLISGLYVFSIPDGELLHTFPGRGHLTSDGETIFTAHHTGSSSQFLHVISWDAQTFEKIKEYPTFHEDLDDIIFSPDGNFFFALEDPNDVRANMPRLFGVNEGAALRTFIPNRDDVAVDNIVFSPDGKRVAMSFEDTVYIWDISDLTASVKQADQY